MVLIRISRRVRVRLLLHVRVRLLMSRLNVLKVLLGHVDLLADGIGKEEAQEERRLLSQLNCLSLEDVRWQSEQWVVSASCSEAGRRLREILLF